MASVVRWLKSVRKCDATGEITIEQGELRPVAVAGLADTLLVMKCTAKVESTAAITAMTTTQQRAFLNSLTLDMRFDGGKSGAAKTTEDEDNLLHPYQKAPLLDVQRVAKRLVEKGVKGLGDSTTGLAQSIASGITNLSFSVYVPLGKVEFVDEDEQLFGVGPDLLRLLQLTVKPTSDYLKGLDNRMYLKELAVDFRSVREKAKGRRVALPPILRKYTPPAPRADVTTVRGVVLDAVDTTAVLASNAKGVFSAKVGTETDYEVVTDSPDTAADAHETYLLHPDIKADSVEASIATEDGTPFYEVPDTAFANMRSGQLFLMQETYTEPWKLQAVIIPTPREGELMRLLQRLSTETLTKGEVNHFVNTPSVTGVKVPAELLTGAGVTAFYATEPEAATLPGLRIDASGEIQLYIPGDKLDEAAGAYAGAMMENNGAGNAKKMEAAVDSIAIHVPGAVEDEVLGLPSNGGSVTATYKAIRDQVQTRARTKLAQLAA